jgi:hypothetical protein
LGKGLRGFLGQIVSDAACDVAVRVFAGEFFGIGTGIRVRSTVGITLHGDGGYLIGSQEANKSPLPPKAELAWWYQFYLATERGRAGYDKYRHDFSKLIWQLASPKWNFNDATFDRSAASCWRFG